VRLLIAMFVASLVVVGAPAMAKAAACPGFTAAEALRDKAVDDKVHSSKLKGAKADGAIANLKSGITSAQSCLGAGSMADRAATLAVIAQLRWNWACVLTYDGVSADKPAAIKLAKTSDHDMDAFMSSHTSLSEDGRVLFQNWEHFDGDIESSMPDSCLE
jgi:hypothetical protein